MKSASRWLFSVFALAVFCLTASLLSSQPTYAQGQKGSNGTQTQPSPAPAQKSPAPAAQTGANAKTPTGSGDVERGRYLVEDVAMCGECHTPRDEHGNLDRSRWLQGAPIWIVPVHADPKWAMRAPPLAGFQPYTDDQGEAVLEKGVGPNGLEIQEPMHIYHMSRADALAIIAYLKSLPNSYPQE
jgi:mono/diheme cytochrome c family protein